MENEYQIHRFGENLRILLAHPTITATDLERVLRKRGVVPASKLKDEMIPLLTGSLLTHQELEELQSLVTDREQRFKLRSRTITTESPVNLASVLIDPIRKEEISSKGPTYFRVVKISPFVRAKTTGEWKASFEVERDNLGKNWANSRTRFEASVELKVEGKDIVITSLHQSKETEQIINRVVGVIKERVGRLSSIVKDQRIMFHHFTSEGRIQFFLSFTGLKGGYADFQKMTDVGISPGDGSEDVPELEWMSDRINQLRLKGNSLQELSYLTDKKFHPYLAMFSSQCNFKFSGLAGKGYYDVVFEFSSHDFSNSQFQISIKSIRNSTTESVESAKRKIYSFLEQIKREKYLEFANFSQIEIGVA